MHLIDIEQKNISGKPENKYDILISYVEWIAEQHYANGLSKSMIIQKAQDTLKRIENM